MTWKFIKTNWFSITLVLMVLAFIVRKNLPFGAGSSAAPGRKERKETNPEKYTAAGGKATLDLVPEMSKLSAQKPAVDKAAAITFVRRFEKVSISERKNSAFRLRCCWPALT
ncbi:MAG: hypothetical protein IPJ82_01335 [Lewinellaceae bacterium]|nr:hypothetical protein [Lewinellaceae bacterium]